MIIWKSKMSSESCDVGFHIEVFRFFLLLFCVGTTFYWIYLAFATVWFFFFFSKWFLLWKFRDIFRLEEVNFAKLLGLSWHHIFSEFCLSLQIVFLSSDMQKYSFRTNFKNMSTCISHAESGVIIIYETKQQGAGWGAAGCYNKVEKLPRNYTLDRNITSGLHELWLLINTFTSTSNHRCASPLSDTELKQRRNQDDFQSKRL